MMTSSSPLRVLIELVIRCLLESVMHNGCSHSFSSLADPYKQVEEQKKELQIVSPATQLVSLVLEAMVELHPVKSLDVLL